MPGSRSTRRGAWHGGFELLDGFASGLPGVTRRRAAPAFVGRKRKPPPAAPAPSGASRSRRRAAPAPADPGGVERALIRLSPRGRRLAALLGLPAGCTSAVPPPPATGRTAGRAGWIDAWVRIESPEAAVLDLLALGAEVEVVRPPELRAELARVARRIADLHGDGTAAS